MARTQRNKPVAKTPDPADIWAEKTAAEVAKAMAAWLKATVNLSRPIASLTKDEMTRLARHTTDTWIVLASRRLYGNAPDDALKQKLQTVLT